MNKNIYRTLLIGLLLQMCVAVEAQTLSWQQCREMALQNNKEITKAKTQMDQIASDVESYKSNFYPRISIIATDIYSTGKGNFTLEGGHLPIYSYSEAAGSYVPNVIVNPDGSYTLSQYADFPSQKLDLKVKNVFMGGIMLNQPLYMGGKITTAYEMSKIGQRMAELNVALTEDDIIVKTDEAYILVIKAKEMIQVAQKYKALLDELMKNVDSAFRHGLKTRNDKMKVQVKLNEAELNITKAENAFRLAKMNLCHYIGLPITSDIDVEAGEAIISGPQESIASNEIDVSNRLEHKLLEMQVEMAKNQVRLTKSDYMPNVVLTGGYTYTNGLELAGKRLINGGQATVGVGVKVPILNFGEGSSKVRSAKAKQQIAQLEQEDMTEKMMLEQQQARNNLEEAAKEVELTKNAFDQAEENVKLSRQQYEVGYETLSDHLESQAIWQKAYADRVDANCQYRLAQVKYQKSLGQISNSVKHQ